jgi:predicted nucleic acid-binding protein
MRILIDTGFLIALCDPRDQYRNAALDLYDFIKIHDCILPWPIFYETFRTDYIRKNDALVLFNQFITNTNIEFFDDKNYRDGSLEKLIDSYNKPNKKYSLVDHVLREIITDIDIKVDGLVTFNELDFMDVCSLRKIEILRY